MLFTRNKKVEFHKNPMPGIPSTYRKKNSRAKVLREGPYWGIEMFSNSLDNTLAKNFHTSLVLLHYNQLIISKAESIDQNSMKMDSKPSYFSLEYFLEQ